MAMTAAKRRGPTRTNGGASDGDGAFNALNAEITNIWQCVFNRLVSVGGTASAITANTDHTVADALTAYTGAMAFFLFPIAVNPGACTISIDEVGVVNLFDKFGDSLLGGELDPTGM